MLVYQWYSKAKIISPDAPPSGRALKKGNNSIAASIPSLPGGALKGGGKVLLKRDLRGEKSEKGVMEGNVFWQGQVSLGKGICLVKINWE